MSTTRGVLTLILLVLCGIGASLNPPSAILMIGGFVSAAWSGWPAWKKMLGFKEI